MIDIIKFIWRLYQPFRRNNPLKVLNAFPYYFKTLIEYKKKGGKISFKDVSPSLFDRSSKSQTGGGHYFYQDIWAIKRIHRNNPKEHVDVGSRFDGFTGQLTAFTKVFAVDIRPPKFTLSNLTFIEGDIMNLPFENQSINSLSCLHTAEHIGLGRYGDPIDPEGIKKALEELMRVLAPGGILYYSMPVGKERTEFNAQRIWNPMHPINCFEELDLVEFSIVDDNDRYSREVDPLSYVNARYACGLYIFRRLNK